MNLKNTSIFTIILVSSLGLLSSCSKDTKTDFFASSYKIVALACGTRQSSFTPEGVQRNINASSIPFIPIGFNDIDNPPTNRDFGIIHENGKYSFVYNETNKKTGTKCTYLESLNGSVSIVSNANIVKLKTNSTIAQNSENDPTCLNIYKLPFYIFNLEGEYEFAQENGYFTLTSESSNYCEYAINNRKAKFIITLEKK